MDTESPAITPAEDQAGKMVRALEKAINGKNILDLSKTFSKKKWDKLKKKHTDNPEQLLSRRDVDKQPCGLYNAGNFCYLNSFLQTWYNDLVFRQCIYDWRPVENFEKPEGAKMNIQDVMNSIQKLFVTMQITPYEHTDASELINLLKLTNDQQDVQEFFILFFDIIHRNLEAHPNGLKIRKTFLSRVEGKTKKTVSCTCGKTNVTKEDFRSIVLHINNGANSLSTLIQEHWKSKDLMPDYLCDKCGERGGTSVSTECASLPPVLVIQISRYIFDPAANRNKKVTSPIQYPRELHETVLRPDADPDSIYELGAVMIHEGPNVSCGHYFDIIRDAKTGNWFSYNDKEVTEVRPPGVSVEKPKISRATADLKGCYVLIYRKADTSSTDSNNISNGLELRMPPAILSLLQQTLNDSFRDKTSGDSMLYKVWNECLNERFDLLEHFWSLLTIDSLRTVTDIPNTVAFLPTELLVDIQDKEYKSVSELKDLDSMRNGTSAGKTSAENEQEDLTEALQRIGEHDSDLETDEEYMQRLIEEAGRLREEKQTSLAKTTELIKAESKDKPIDEDMLKLLYTSEPPGDIFMPLCPHEKISIEAVGRGVVKAVNRSVAEKLLSKYNIGVCLKRYSNDEQENGTTKEEGLQLAGLKTGADLCEECVDLMRREANFKSELDNCTKMVDSVKKRSTAKGINGYEYPPPDAFWVSRAQLFAYKKTANNEMKYQKSRIAQKPASLIFSTKIDGFLESQQQNNGDDEDPPTKRIRLETNEEPTESAAQNPESPTLTNGNASPIELSPDIELIYEKAKPVYINDDLICPHDGLNSRAKKVWLHAHEWQKLVVDIFQTYREFPVTTKECEECSKAFNINEAKRSDCQEKLQQISQTINPILKRIEKRVLTPESWEDCTHLLCSKFVYKFRNALRNKTAIMPTICQECLSCADHQLPFQQIVAGGVENSSMLRHYDEAGSGVSATPTCNEYGVPLQGIVYNSLVTGPLPITQDEWESLLSEFRSACDDFEMPIEVRIKNGSFTEFCTECETRFNQTRLKTRCTYPDGGEVFVKLKDDEADGAEKPSNGARTTTRRRALKNLIKIRIKSTQTVRDLKLQLYQRTKQTPSDQLIYMGETLLEDKSTLGEAFVPCNNDTEPLTLITQQHTDISNEPRVLEKGFCDTALA